MKNFVLALLLAFGALGALQVAAPTPAFATTATYNPRFLDSSGNPVAGATVTFWNLSDPHDSGHILFTSTTDNLGYLYPGVTLTVGNAYYFTTSSAAVPNGQFVAPSPQSIVVIPANGGLFLDTSSVAQTKAGALTVTGGVTLGVALPIGSGGTGATTATGNACVQANSGATAYVSAAGPCVTSVTIGTGLTGGGTSTAPTVALTTPVAVANGGTGATAVTAGTCIRAPSTSALASAGGDCVVLSPGSQQTGTINVSGLVTAAGSFAVPTFTSGDCVNVTTGGTLADAGFPCGNGAGSVNSVTAGTGIAVTGTSSAPIVGLSVPVTIAHGGTGATAVTASTCIRASSTTLLASAAGDCVTSVTASGNLSSSGGTTPAITMTASPTFSGTITDSSSLALTCSSASGCGVISDATGTNPGFVFDQTGGSTGDLVDFQVTNATVSHITNAGGFVGPSVAVTGAVTGQTVSAGTPASAIEGGDGSFARSSTSGAAFFGSGSGAAFLYFSTPTSLLISNGSSSAVTVNAGPITSSGTFTSNVNAGSNVLVWNNGSSGNNEFATGVGTIAGISDYSLGLYYNGGTLIEATDNGGNHAIAGGYYTAQTAGYTMANAATGGTTVLGTSGGAIAGISAQAFYVYTPSASVQQLAVDDAGDMGIAGGYYSASSRALKDQIKPFHSADYLIAHTKIVTFCYRAGLGKPCPKGAQTHIGFIADDTPSGFSGPNHNRMDVNAVEAASIAEEQELRAEIRQLAREIARNRRK